MKVTEKTIPSDLPQGSGSASDPDFNDAVPPEGQGPKSIDPDQSDFRDAIQVGSYASVGALRTEIEQERQETEQATLNVLEAMRAMDAGDQVKWRISRSGHENDELNGYLETWPNHQMTIERLRDRFGGGTYYCKGFRRGKYMAHETLQISGEAKRKPSGVEGVNQSVPVAAAPQFDMQGFLMAQERRDEKRREDERRERQEREEREEKRRSDRMQLLLTLGPAAITALGGLFQGQKVDYMPLIAAMKGPDPITVLTQLKALQGNNDGALTKILPMLIDMAGSKASGGDTGWLDVMKELAKSAGPTIGGMIEMSVQQARANAVAAQSASIPIPPALAPPNSNSVSASPGSSNSGPGDNTTGVIVMPSSVSRRERPRRSVTAASLPAGSAPMPAGPAAATVGAPLGPAIPVAPGGLDMNLLPLVPHLPWLKDQLTRMLGAARRGKDPEVYAALFLEEAPEGIEAAVLGNFLARADWYPQLMSLEPGLNDPQLEPWFQQLRTLLLRSLLSESGAGGADVTASSGPSWSALPPPAEHVLTPRPPERPTERPTELPSLTRGRT